ncbi:uncharacterized protein H6S33_010982 [Morchella sextelata]|uniref:uncharacterized protein n=1 Tax=Morchella sextelata TaxID=1174677 RepID=UPI001D04D11B|nr:uncharacterized protein H6S33_010982 [Morchella sextelata]KAH0611717.1 hypothetical protein H6S33_010982 [Morchella sextelata]
MVETTINPLAFQREKPITLNEILRGTLVDELHALFYHIHISLNHLSGRFELFQASHRYFDDLRYLQGTLHQCYQELRKAPLAAYKLLPFRRRATELLMLLPRLVYLFQWSEKTVVHLRPVQLRAEVEEPFMTFWHGMRDGFLPLRGTLEAVTHMYVLIWDELSFQEWYELEKVWEACHQQCLRPLESGLQELDNSAMGS